MWDGLPTGLEHATFLGYQVEEDMCGRHEAKAIGQWEVAEDLVCSMPDRNRATQPVQCKLDMSSNMDRPDHPQW